MERHRCFGVVAIRKSLGLIPSGANGIGVKYLFKEEKMLVLSRAKGESITITGPDGTVISLMVVDVRGQRIRLGMDAPKDWKIMRVELKEQSNEGT